MIDGKEKAASRGGHGIGDGNSAINAGSEKLFAVFPHRDASVEVVLFRRFRREQVHAKWHFFNISPSLYLR